MPRVCWVKMISESLKYGHWLTRVKIVIFFPPHIVDQWLVSSTCPYAADLQGEASILYVCNMVNCIVQDTGQRLTVIYIKKTMNPSLPALCKSVGYFTD